MAHTFSPSTPGTAADGSGALSQKRGKNEGRERGSLTHHRTAGKARYRRASTMHHLRWFQKDTFMMVCTENSGAHECLETTDEDGQGRYTVSFSLWGWNTGPYDARQASILPQTH